MKKSPLRKKSKTKISTLKNKLWDVFSKFIRKRDKGICFICKRVCKESGYHAAHFIPKSVGGVELYFSELNVNGCCYHCNINLGGNLYEYGVKLGAENVKKLYEIKNRVISKWTEQDYLGRIEHYKKLSTMDKNDSAIMVVRTANHTKHHDSDLQAP